MIPSDDWRPHRRGGNEWKNGRMAVYCITNLTAMIAQLRKKKKKRKDNGDLARLVSIASVCVDPKFTT